MLGCLQNRAWEPSVEHANRTLARAWRGHGAGYRPFVGLGGAGVARAWRGRGAGPVTPGVGASAFASKIKCRCQQCLVPVDNSTVAGVGDLG
eukprot:gene25161-biopygen4484